MRVVERPVLPGPLAITTTVPAVAGDLLAQGNSDSIGRRTLGCAAKTERVSNDVNGA